MCPGNADAPAPRTFVVASGMRATARWLASAAAVLCLVGGLLGLLETAPSEGRAPRWSGLVEPLRQAPIEPGATVALVLPPTSQAELLLREAAWQRPDLRFGLIAAWPAGSEPTVTAVLGGARVPEGWERAWQGGGWTVMVRVVP